MSQSNAFIYGFVKAAVEQGLSEAYANALLKRGGYSLTNADLGATIRNFNTKKPNIHKPEVNKQSFKSKYPRVNKDINISQPAEIVNPTVKHPVVKNPEVKDSPVLNPPSEIKAPTVKAPKPIVPPQMPLQTKPIDLSQSALLNRTSEGTQLSS